MQSLADPGSMAPPTKCLLWIPLGELTVLPQTSWISGEGKGIGKGRISGRRVGKGEGQRGVAPKKCFRSASECSATVLCTF